VTPRPSHVPYVFGFTLLAITTAIFLIAGWKIHNFDLAWNILAGSSSSFTKVSWITLPLGILGYLLVPCLIGIVVGTFVQKMVRSSLNSTPKIEKKIGEFGRTPNEVGDEQE
jgi:hypothetical protein